jgi:putative acetyltransferase
LIRIRPETPADVGEVQRIHRLAFGRDAEAAILAELRATARPQLSLVALDDDGTRTGHVFFGPVELEGHSFERPPLGLGPLAVLPGRQTSGVGQALVRAGLEQAHALGTPFVVVLGHPPYYPRFGFRLASEHGLYFEQVAPRPSFFVIELAPGALAGVSGVVHYPPAFYRA